MHPQMTDLLAAQATRTHRNEIVSQASSERHRSARFGERRLRIRIARRIVSIRLRWEAA